MICDTMQWRHFNPTETRQLFSVFFCLPASVSMSVLFFVLVIGNKEERKSLGWGYCIDALFIGA